MATSVLDGFLTPTTELQAVNVILMAMGERPVNALANAQGSSVARAISTLGDTLRSHLTAGWACNTEDAYTIDPSGDGSITLPSNLLDLRQVYFEGGYDKKLVQRGTKLYDRANSTFNIGIPVKLEMTVALAFEDLPEAHRRYITVRAARVAASGKLVSSTVYQFTKADEDEARLRMEQSEDKADGDNTLAGNPHIRRQRRR